VDNLIQPAIPIPVAVAVAVQETIQPVVLAEKEW
jgi:hypothetical protein